MGGRDGGSGPRPKLEQPGEYSSAARTLSDAARGGTGGGRIVASGNAGQSVAAGPVAEGKLASSVSGVVAPRASVQADVVARAMADPVIAVDRISMTGVATQATVRPDAVAAPAAVVAAADQATARPDAMAASRVPAGAAPVATVPTPSGPPPVRRRFGHTP